MTDKKPSDAYQNWLRNGHTPERAMHEVLLVYLDERHAVGQHPWETWMRKLGEHCEHMALWTEDCLRCPRKGVDAHRYWFDKSPVAEPPPLVAGESTQELERLCDVAIGRCNDGWVLANWVRGVGFECGDAEFVAAASPRRVKGLIVELREVKHERNTALANRDTLQQQLDHDRQLYEKDVARLEAEREPVAGGPTDVSFDLSDEVHAAMDKMIEGLGPEAMAQAAALMPEHLPAHWQALTTERDTLKSQLTAAQSALEQANARVVEVEAERDDWKRQTETRIPDTHRANRFGAILSRMHGLTDCLEAHVSTEEAGHCALSALAEANARITAPVDWVGAQLRRPDVQEALLAQAVAIEARLPHLEEASFLLYDIISGGHTNPSKREKAWFKEAKRQLEEPVAIAQSTKRDTAPVATPPSLLPDVEETDEPAPKLSAEADGSWDAAWGREFPTLVEKHKRDQLSNERAFERAGFKYGFLAAVKQRDAALSQVEALTKELSEIRRAFTERCWDAGSLGGDRLVGAVISVLQSQSVLRSQLRKTQQRYDERDEELQKLEDVVRELGGDHEQGPEAFIRASNERAGRLAKQLENLPDRFSASVFHRAGLSLEDSVMALTVSRRILEDAERAAEPPQGAA